MYEEKRTITITGAVVKYEWSNPHVYIFVDQSSGSGSKVEWEIEGSPPSILRRLGWSRDTLRVGDVITVTGKPARDPAKKALLPATIARGTTMLFDRSHAESLLSEAGGAAAPLGKGLDGVWVTLLSQQVEEDPEKLPLTAQGTAASKRFDERKMHPGVNCVPFPAPIFMYTPDLKRIASKGTVILIDGEFDGAERTVHMDVANHEGAPDSLQGHSIGRWEGKSLVIDTTHFAPHLLGNAYGLPSGPHKHLVERLTPNPDGRSLTYHYELTDSDFLARSVSADVQWVFRPDAKYAPETCNRENARRFTEGSTTQSVSPGRTYPLQLLAGSRLLIDARINGRAVEALLDSAAETTLLDAKFAQRAGILSGDRTVGRGSGKSTFEAELVSGVSLSALGVDLANQSVAVADLSDVSARLLARPIDAILGRELFDAARLLIDIRRGEIRVLAPTEVPRGARLDLAAEHGVETIPASIEGHPAVRATFDLGNGSHVLIARRYAEQLGLLRDGRAVRHERGGGLGGEADREVLVLRTLEIASRRFTDVSAAIDPGSSASDLNVGVSVLRDFIITTDFKGRAVWLMPAN
jgi:predicted aspartyl protease